MVPELVNDRGELTPEGQRLSEALAERLGLVGTDAHRLPDHAERYYAELVLSPSPIYTPAEYFGDFTGLSASLWESLSEQRPAPTVATVKAAKPLPLIESRTLPGPALQALADAVIAKGEAGAPLPARRLLALVRDGADPVELLADCHPETIGTLQRWAPPRRLTPQEQWIADHLSRQGKP